MKRPSSLPARWSRARAGLQRLAASPLTYVYVACIILRIPGLFWGLPSTDGWDDDAVAPRDFLPGLVETFTPGHFYTYPPVHLILLAIASAPVWIAKLVMTHSTNPQVLLGSFLTVPTMTAFSVIARSLAIVFGCVTIHALSQIAGAMVPAQHAKRASFLTAVMLVGNATLTYYGQVGNLDGPYLAWSSLALLELVRADVKQQPKRWFRFALYAALAVGTKDQAYAVFLLAIPLWLVVRALTSSAARKHARAELTAIALAAVCAISLLLLLDGALINPRGFLARIHFLLGPASQDHAYYTQDFEGHKRLLYDVLWLRLPNYYPRAVWALLPAGVLVALWPRRNSGGARLPQAGLATRLLPLFAMVSFTVAFNMTARRTEHRFLLPQTAFAAIYMGLAVERLSRFPALGVPAVIAVALVALRGSIGTSLGLLHDPRYEAEAWLMQHAANARIEVYGNNVYLPRIPRTAVVTRVGDDPLNKRGRIPGFTEVQAEPAAVETRKPDILVVADMWSGSFYAAVGTPEPGYFTTKWMRLERSDGRTLDFIVALDTGHTMYRRALRAECTNKLLNTTRVHASVCLPVTIYERVAPEL